MSSKAELSTVWTSLGSIPLKSPLIPSFLTIFFTILFHLAFYTLICCLVLITVIGYVHKVDIILEMAPMRKMIKSYQAEFLSIERTFLSCS